MGKFYPLYVRRSDGKLDTPLKNRREANAPTKEQLDQTPDKNGVSDFYREIPFDEAKHLDWRRKLGGMLAREMDCKDKASGGMSKHFHCIRNIVPDQHIGNGFVLAAFPENYRLYEHVKRTEKDGKTEVKSKTHAAGGNDRQDAYLYGHPAGKRKRFRSPGDFFPHLLWLCTDETGDPNNCSCKLCSPEDLENAIPGAKAKVEKVDKPEKAEKLDKVDKEDKPEQSQKEETAERSESAPVQDQRNTAVSRPAQPSVSTPTPVQSTQRVAVPPPAQATAQPTPQRLPQSLPPLYHRDQQLDNQYRGFMYRPGELVWFQRGQAWGLGTVLQRWITPQIQYHYMVQPLSYPGHLQPPVHKTSSNEMRPWLAWSVPKYTNVELNRMNFGYDDADWQGILSKRYGNGDVEVDASILAAKSIDSSFTFFDMYDTVSVEPGVSEKRYRGAFLGGEKFWQGEPVRLSVGSTTDLMILHEIVEQIRTSPPSRSVYFTGDVYRLTAVKHYDPDVPSPAAARNNPQLPPRVNEDLAFRNARSIAAKQTASFWSMIAGQARVDLDQIKGRWYEASVLLPVLLSQFEEMVNKGDIQEASMWMNARGDCLNANRPAEMPQRARQNVYRETRREALGRAIPPNAELRDGIEPPIPSGHVPDGAAQIARGVEIDPRFEAADGMARGPATTGPGDFIDMAHVESRPGAAHTLGQPYGGDSGPGRASGSYY